MQTHAAAAAAPSSAEIIDAALCWLVSVLECFYVWMMSVTGWARVTHHRAESQTQQC
jgi:hypothetical protein